MSSRAFRSSGIGEELMPNSDDRHFVSKKARTNVESKETLLRIRDTDYEREYLSDYSQNTAPKDSGLDLDFLEKLHGDVSIDKAKPVLAHSEPNSWLDDEDDEDYRIEDDQGDHGNDSSDYDEASVSSSEHHLKKPDFDLVPEDSDRKHGMLSYDARENDVSNTKESVVHDQEPYSMSIHTRTQSYKQDRPLDSLPDGMSSPLQKSNVNRSDEDNLYLQFLMDVDLPDSDDEEFLPEDAENDRDRSERPLSGIDKSVSAVANRTRARVSYSQIDFNELAATEALLDQLIAEDSDFEVEADDQPGQEDSAVYLKFLRETTAPNAIDVSVKSAYRSRSSSSLREPCNLFSQSQLKRLFSALVRFVRLTKLDSESCHGNLSLCTSLSLFASECITQMQGTNRPSVMESPKIREMVTSFSRRFDLRKADHTLVQVPLCQEHQLKRNHKNKATFTSAEDNLLLQGMKRFVNFKNTSLQRYFFPHRSYSQVYHRLKNLGSKSYKAKSISALRAWRNSRDLEGKPIYPDFTRNEDARLCRGVCVLGFENFEGVCREWLPHRTERVVASRWHELLNSHEDLPRCNDRSFMVNGRMRSSNAIVWTREMDRALLVAFREIDKTALLKKRSRLANTLDSVVVAVANVTRTSHQGIDVSPDDVLFRLKTLKTFRQCLHGGV